MNGQDSWCHFIVDMIMIMLFVNVPNFDMKVVMGQWATNNDGGGRGPKKATVTVIEVMMVSW